MGNLLPWILLWSCILLAVNGGHVDKENSDTREMSIPDRFYLPSALTSILSMVHGAQPENVKDTPMADDPCTPNPCKTFGVCINIGSGKYRCDCPPFVGGERCGYGQCISIPFWPKAMPQPLYKYCTHPEICVLEMKNEGGNPYIHPSCVCDHAEHCNLNRNPDA